MTKFRVGMKIRLKKPEEVSENPGWIEAWDLGDTSMDDLLGEILEITKQHLEVPNWWYLNQTNWCYSEKWFLPVSAPVQEEYI